MVNQANISDFSLALFSHTWQKHIKTKQNKKPKAKLQEMQGLFTAYFPGHE